MFGTDVDRIVKKCFITLKRYDEEGSKREQKTENKTRRSMANQNNIISILFLMAL